MNDLGQKLRGGQFAVWLASEYQSINFALTARLQGAVTPEQFRLALEKLRIKYPPLSMRMAAESDRSVYLIPDSSLTIPIRIVERKQSEQWVDEVVVELDLAFDLLHDPPLRLVWLRGENISEILFVCPHVLADGLAHAVIFENKPQTGDTAKQGGGLSALGLGIDRRTDICPGEAQSE